MVMVGVVDIFGQSTKQNAADRESPKNHFRPGSSIFKAPGGIWHRAKPWVCLALSSPPVILRIKGGRFFVIFVINKTNNKQQTQPQPPSVSGMLRNAQCGGSHMMHVVAHASIHLRSCCCSC
jgi:hypothetical protein